VYATAIPPVCLKFDKIQDGGHLGYTKWPWLHYQFADWRHVRFYGGILDWAWDFCLRGLHTGTAVARDPCVSWAFLLKMRWAELVLMTWRLKSHLVIWCFVLSDCFLLQSNLEVPLQAWLIDWLIDGWMDGWIDRSINRSINNRSIDRSIFTFMSSWQNDEPGLHVWLQFVLKVCEIVWVNETCCYILFIARTHGKSPGVYDSGKSPVIL